MECIGIDNRNYLFFDGLNNFSRKQTGKAPRITPLIWEEPTGILGVETHYVERQHLEKLNSFLFLFKGLLSLTNVSI